jgi:protein-S-isoprenylcysteine O-methyltransferase Ste14
MIYHTLFALLFFCFIFIRVAYHRKAKRTREAVELKESKLNMAVRAVVGLGYIGALLIYAFFPRIFSWSVLPLLTWARWVGAGVSVLSLLLIWWVQWALDVQFDTTLHIQAGHKLVTHGPYRWVRHPMYTTLFLMGAGWLLLTANWFIGGPLMPAIVLIVLVRVNYEETVLIETFGDAYLTYKQKTGRFLPPLRRLFNGGSRL